MSIVELGFTFTWRIENFSMLPQRGGTKLVSPAFVVDDYWEDLEWRLLFYPRGQNEEKENIVSLFLELHGNQQVKVHFAVSIDSVEGTNNIRRLETYKFNKDNWGWPVFCTLNEIFGNRSLYLPQDVLTLRCQMLPDGGIPEKFNTNGDLELERYFTKNSCTFRTTTPVHKRFIMWPIRNVSRPRKCVEEFCVATLKDTPNFKLSLNLSNIATQEFAPIQIEMMADSLDEEVELVYVVCKIQVMASKTTFREIRESSHFFDTNKKIDVWKFPPLIRTSSLKRDEYLFVDDTLYLIFDFAFSYEGKESHMEDNYMPMFLDSKETSAASDIAASIEKCYLNGKYCDVELVSEGETFPAHKLLLSARSPVFCAMFENDMKEKNSGIVTVEDVDPRTLNRLLTFLHSDILREDLSTEETCKLYKAADKYNIEPLKLRCSVLLVSCLSVTSVCDVLIIADAHQDDFLFRSIYYFIRCHSTEVFSSLSWQVFMNSHLKLAAEVMLDNLKYRRY